MDGASDNIRTEQTSIKCFRCGSEDHLIEKCPKPPKDNYKWRKQLRFNEEGNRACETRNNNSDQKIYAFMERMSSDDEFPGGNFGDSPQLINWIMDSGATCHMTLEVSDFISGSLEDTDKKLKLRTEITSQQNKKVKYE